MDNLDAEPYAGLLPQSMNMVVGDQLALVRNAIECRKVPVDILLEFRTPEDKSASPKLRSLSMIAAYHGCLEVLAYLLSAGCNPNLAAPDDGSTPLHCAAAGRSPKTAEVIALLLHSGAARDVVDHAGKLPVDLLHAAPTVASDELPVAAPDSVAEADSELDNPEFRTDEFRMYGFKVAKCEKPEAHDWTECPFAHPGEKARRRDPRLFSYSGNACPDFRKGSCKRGDACPYAHGVFECWLHPIRYRTQLCKDAPTCQRRVCFFAHSLDELRQTTEAPTRVLPLDDASVTPAGNAFLSSCPLDLADVTLASACLKLPTQQRSKPGLLSVSECFKHSGNSSPTSSEHGDTSSLLSSLTTPSLSMAAFEPNGLPGIPSVNPERLYDPLQSPLYGAMRPSILDAASRLDYHLTSYRPLGLTASYRNSTNFGNMTCSDIRIPFEDQQYTHYNSVASVAALAQQQALMDVWRYRLGGQFGAFQSECV